MQGKVLFDRKKSNGKKIVKKSIIYPEYVIAITKLLKMLSFYIFI